MKLQCGIFKDFAAVEIFIAVCAESMLIQNGYKKSVIGYVEIK